MWFVPLTSGFYRQYKRGRYFLSWIASHLAAFHTRLGWEPTVAIASNPCSRYDDLAWARKCSASGEVEKTKIEAGPAKPQDNLIKITGPSVIKEVPVCM
jgi:hypothetical protein